MDIGMVRARVAAIVAALVARTCFRLLDLLATSRHPVVGPTYRVLWSADRRWPPHAPSFEAVRHAKAVGLAPDALTWGETPLWVARDVLVRAGFGPGRTLLDLGAGRGMVLLAARMLEGRARGVELDGSRVAPVRGALGAVDIELLVGDAREADLTGVTHVWLSWTCLPPAVRDELARMLLALPPGARAICFTWPLHDERAPSEGPFVLIHEERRRLPWGATDVMIVERRAVPPSA